ncbi:hypothetical protein [Exiguobacterium sp. s193]|uniref:hypothetical protein n=1 Tax=Exiguobacterium sp. s193 TaxID=2751207 RepID=UPI001BE55EBD|nr:hypothetical protein [Exiguobacterium sp. s193]
MIHVNVPSGDYIVLVEINREVLLCQTLEEADHAERDRYELVGRMSERLPAEVIGPSIADFVRFSTGFIGEAVTWNADEEAFFCQQFETFDGSPLGEDLTGIDATRWRAVLARYYSYVTIGKIIPFEVSDESEGTVPF